MPSFGLDADRGGIHRRLLAGRAAGHERFDAEGRGGIGLAGEQEDIHHLLRIQRIAGLVAVLMAEDHRDGGPLTRLEVSLLGVPGIVVPVACRCPRAAANRAALGPVFTTRASTWPKADRSQALAPAGWRFMPG